MIPASRVFDQTILTTLLDHDPVLQDYRQFFALLDWSLVHQWEGQQSLHRRPPLHPEAAYIKAFLLRIREGFISSTQLRRYLLKHPLLIIELGFHLELDPSAPYGFDAHKTLPSRYWLGEKLRTLDPVLLQDLLEATVHSLQAEILADPLKRYVSFQFRLLAELHGRMGRFPTLNHLRPMPGPLTEFEIAELLNMQTLREEARKHR
ncbi:CRISPR-associated protein Csx15 [Ktedonospora formicarum]|uniref:Uncharacterized protein n=1 Tax=Ktedonospora formicarum TaxID=2778364 RepID=A0A8J3I7P2_9CHLR|nr:CRISPR-associated protein Csx15 [Ktedonospora formicarum]GHO47572.1 hypothetical protein KSX_57350 [Ktedonospora formicarum]